MELAAGTITSTTLLEGLRDLRNAAAWAQFDARYRPMVVAFARQLGLRSEDAHDAAQETILAFVRAYQAGGYDRRRGRLRSWLFAIASRKVSDLRRAQPQEGACPEGTLPALSEDEAKKAWETEWQRHVVQACLAEVSRRFDARTVEAFDLYALKEWPVEKVAVRLGMTENTVYGAKHRVMTSIRALMPRMDEIW